MWWNQLSLSILPLHLVRTEYLNFTWAHAAHLRSVCFPRDQVLANRLRSKSDRKLHSCASKGHDVPLTPSWDWKMDWWQELERPPRHKQHRMLDPTLRLRFGEQESSFPFQSYTKRHSQPPANCWNYLPELPTCLLQRLKIASWPHITQRAAPTWKKEWSIKSTHDFLGRKLSIPSMLIL